MGWARDPSPDATGVALDHAKPARQLRVPMNHSIRTQVPSHALDRSFRDQTLPPQTRTRRRRLLRSIAALMILIGLGAGANHWLQTHRAMPQGSKGSAAQLPPLPVGSATIGTG